MLSTCLHMHLVSLCCGFDKTVKSNLDQNVRNKKITTNNQQIKREG